MDKSRQNKIIADLYARVRENDGGDLLQIVANASADNLSKPFRLPVQIDNAVGGAGTGVFGTIASGTIRMGDPVVVLPGARTSRVKTITNEEGEHDEAVAGQSVTVALEDDIEIASGDVLAGMEHRPEFTDQFQAHVIWLDNYPLMPGRSYLIKTANKTTTGEVTELKHRVDMKTFGHDAAKVIRVNEVAVCNFGLDEDIVYDAYKDNAVTGSFVIVDKRTTKELAVGLIDFGLRRATNVHWQAVDVNKQARSQQKNQKPVVLWFTGLSASGKSTIANLIEKKLQVMGKHTYLLDGDNVRHGLNRDLGFVEADRVENIRRVGEVAKLMVDAGLIVLTAFISPFRSERRMVRQMLEDHEFVEIFVDTPIEICEQRDPKGLYKKARAGEIKNFTGFDSPYEAPEDADIRLDMADKTAEEAADIVVESIMERYLS